MQDSNSEAAQKSKTEIVAPVVLVAIGVGWLLSSLDIVSGVSWVWSLGLAAAGVLVLFSRGMNKGSIVIGPFLLVSAALSVFRQTGKLSLDVEVPLLFITLGVLLFVSRLSNLPSGIE